MPATLVDSPVSTLAAWRVDVASLDPARYDGESARRLTEELARLEKACAGVRARFAARAAACGAHRSAGFHDPADWFARQSGTSLAQARDALELASTLDECPATANALANGTLSLAQAAEITKTEREAPGSERDMLAVAEAFGLRKTQDEGRRRRAAAVPAERLEARQRAARSLREGRDALGMVVLSATLEPAVGVPLANRLRAETDRLRRAAGQSGNDTTWEQFAADAFVNLFNSTARSGPGRVDMVVVVDQRALARGHAHQGEPTHIIGGGPISVETAKTLIAGGDAFVKGVLHDGTDLKKVKHFGRHIPAELRTALAIGKPPDFTGPECAEEGCGRLYATQWDHENPVANSGPTEYANLQPLCGPHHRAKTERDRAAGLLRARPRDHPPPTST